MTRQPLTTEHILLGFLAEEPLHGYELHQRLNDPEALGTVWRVKQARLYALLARLEAEELVRAVVQEQDARPARKTYHLTAEGQARLDAWLRDPVPHGRELRIEFLAKFYFARRQGEATARALVNAQKAQFEQWLAETPPPPESAPYRRLVYAFRAGQLRAMLEWLDLCAETLHR